MSATEKQKTGQRTTSRIKRYLARLYVIAITLGFIHLLIAAHSPSYRDIVMEIEEKAKKIELPVLNPTPTPIYFSSEEYGGDAYLPKFVLEPGWYRWEMHNAIKKPLSLPECDLRNVLGDPLGRFKLDVSCEIMLTVFGHGNNPWHIKIEREP